MSKPAFNFEFIKSLRVEPLLFIFCIAVFSYTNGSVSLTSQKVCFPEGPPGVSEVCKNTERLKQVADVAQVKSIVRDCVPAVIVILAGSWRDVSGRTLPLFVMPIIFEMVATAIDLISYLYWDMSPLLAGILSSIIGSIGGSRTTVTMASLAYITATSTDEFRAMRMPVLMVAMMGGICISAFSAGYVLTAVNYEVFYLGILVLYGLTIFLAFLLLEDKRLPASPTASYCDTFIRLKAIFKTRPNNFYIWMFIIATTLITSMLSVEGAVSAAYLQGKFDLPPAQIGLFSGYKTLISLIAGAVAMPLLKKVFKLKDFTIAFICVVPSVISCIGLAFSETLVHLYIFGTLDLLRIVLIATLMHLFTGLLQKSEIGLFTSFLSFTEGMLPLGLNPLYTYIYKSSIETMPGAFYLISAGVLILSGIFLWVISCSYNPIPHEEEDNE